MTGPAREGVRQVPVHGSRSGAKALVAGLAAVALGAAACSTDREVTRPEPVPVTEELLEESLLTEADVPSGWAAGDGDPIGTEVVPGHDCDDTLSELDPELQASVQFTRDGVVMTNTAAWFPGQGRAAENVYRDLLEDCRSVVLPDQSLAIRAASLDFGVLSDNTLPVRIEFEPSSGTITEADLIVMRRGDLLHVIRLLGPRPSDKGLLDGVVRIAIGRLGRLHQVTT